MVLLGAIGRVLMDGESIKRGIINLIDDNGTVFLRVKGNVPGVIRTRCGHNHGEDFISCEKYPLEILV
jgi:hypothetical protein